MIKLKCKICGKEFSSSVFPFHYKFCKEKKEKELKEKETELEKLTVKELEEVAKEKGLTGYSDLKKAELVDLLVGE